MNSHSLEVPKHYLVIEQDQFSPKKETSALVIDKFSNTLLK